MTTAQEGRKLLLIVTGSIAAYKVATLASRLYQLGWQVQVVATEAALQLVGEATWEGLTGRRVASKTFEPGRMMDHLRLLREADLVLVAPATADYLARCAAGLGNDLAAALFLAHDFTKPWLVAPAMNVAMWEHPATRSSVERLRGMGVTVIEPGVGPMACGEAGGGRLAEPEGLLEAVLRSAELAKGGRERRPGRVLVTAGGTQEPVDAVRVLTNRSTGRTGVALAERFGRAGWEVVLLRAKGVPAAGPAVAKQVEFTTVASLADALRAELRDGTVAAVVHAAAVGDYTVAAVRGADGREHLAGGKLESGGGATIELQPAPKLIDQLRDWAGRPDLRVVGFKLTATIDAAARRTAVAALLERAQPDFVVHNDALDWTEGRHPYAVIGADGSEEEVADLARLGDRLVACLERSMAPVP